MNTESQRPDLEFTEPERYELHEGPFYHFEISRRGFVHVLGAGILISVASPAGLAQRAGRSERSINLAQRLHIGADGLITLFTSKVEIGQGSRTQLTQAAAEELHVPVERMRLVMADTAVVPDDGGTAGSRTTPSTVPAVRQACAAARQLLIETAAANFNVDAKGLSVVDGAVQGLAAGQRFSYTEFSDEKHAAALERGLGQGVPVTPVNEWRVLGTSTDRIGGRDIVTGAHRYPSDIVRPGMLYGKVLRPAAFGAELTKINLEPARALPGVIAVQDGDFIGFAAPTSFAAEKARDEAAKTAQWKTATQPSSDELFDYLRQHASPPRGGQGSRESTEEALKNAKKVLRQSYLVAYIQHAPMEPRAAVAEWADAKVTVWTGTQQPGRVHQEVARAMRLPRESVRIVVPDTGGGFGGKHSGEVAVEAARLAREAKKPVSVRWSREDEFTWAYCRPAGVIDVAGGLNEDGQLVGWEHVNFNSGGSAIGTPYRVASASTEFRSCEQPLRSGSYRALAATANTFARESFMDELAAEAGVDPLEFRLRHLPDDRLRAVLVAAAERFGWETARKKHAPREGIGVGLACGTEKGSFTACCVEVQAKDGRFHVVKVTASFECGAIQNPKNLHAQTEGCILQGLGGALWEEMRFEDGKVLNPRFSQYYVPRFRNVPEIDLVFLDRPDLPSVGAGETPIIGIAPAIANALFHATGVRIRALPIKNAEYRART